MDRGLRIIIRSSEEKVRLGLELSKASVRDVVISLALSALVTVALIVTTECLLLVTMFPALALSVALVVMRSRERVRRAVVLEETLLLSGKHLEVLRRTLGGEVKMRVRLDEIFIVALRDKIVRLGAGTKRLKLRARVVEIATRRGLLELGAWASPSDVSRAYEELIRALEALTQR